MPPKTLFAAIRDEENREVANKLAFTSVLMATLPVITFYALQQLAFKGWESADMYAGFGAVTVANVVIVGYVIMAYNEPDPEGEEARKPVPPVGIWATKKTD